MSENLEAVPLEDFVTDPDHRSVKRHRLPLLRHWDGGGFCKHGSRLAETFNIVKQVSLLTRDRAATNEAALATTCNADIDSSEWKEDIEQLYSRGHLIVVRTEWSLDSCWVKLPPEQTKIRLTTKGQHFAAARFEQLMAER
jgi:hypothetical protein